MTTRVQIGNIAMRAIPLGAKYVFALILVRLYPLGDVGLYNNTVGYASVLGLLIGLQYYYYVNRELPRADAVERRKLLVTQLSFDVVVYAVTLVPLLAIFRNMHGLGPVLVGLTFVSHLNLESYRALYALGRPIVASVVFGVGNGLWAVPLAAWLLKGDHPPSIGSILVAIAAFNAIAAGLGIWSIHRQTFVGRPVGPDWRRVVVGLRISVPIMASVVAQRASELLGRFLLEFSAGLVAVGIFSSFQVLASSILIVVESGVAVIALPHLVRSRATSADVYRIHRRKALAQTVVGVVMSSVLLLALARPLFALLGQAALETHITAFYLMVVAYAALGLASYFGLVMYVEHLDRELVVATLTLALANGIGLVLALFVFRGGPIAAALVLMSWSLSNLVAKWYLSGTPERRDAGVDLVS